MLVFSGIINSDFVFIHREAAPIGPPIFEFIIAKIFRKKIIYDFDDSIWLPDFGKSSSWIRWIKCYWKIKWICRWSYKVVCGNQHLSSWAKQYNLDVVQIPTVVNTESGHDKIKEHHSGMMVVGWTGSHSTLNYLQEIIPIIAELQKAIDFEFVIIADVDPQPQLRYYRFIKWKSETENLDLLNFDIGIMPLVNDQWSNGKCGFKLIQYFAAGIPAVASPVGVNCDIIDEGVNGYLCRSSVEWKNAFFKLLNDKDLRSEMGKNGRLKAEKFYSLKSQKNKFLELFTV